MAGAGNPDVATALAAIADEAFYTIVTPYNDVTNVGKVETELAARWGASVMYTLYSELPADNHGHLFPPERQARLFEVVAELKKMRQRMPQVIGNTSWYFDMIPTYIGGTVISGCTAGKKTMHVSPGGQVRACAELPMVGHWSTYDPRVMPDVDCTRCFQACRGEVQAPITLGRVVEALRS